MNLVYIAHPQPFWFVEIDLLADLLRAELTKLTTIRDRHTNLHGFFESPDATKSQRKVCFLVLAHGKVLEIISELFASRYEPSPQLSEEHSRILLWVSSLVASDAPDWVLETNRVADRLPEHLKDALPEPLRAESYNTNDPVRMTAIESAVKVLNTLESLRSLIERVTERQFRRLSLRWAPKVKNPKHWLQGTQGLRRKPDSFSRYSDNLTDKQQLAATLRWTHDLGLTEVAARMGVSRKTVAGHLEAATRKMNQSGSNEKRRRGSAKDAES
jgi:hypothetical protein